MRVAAWSKSTVSGIGTNERAGTTTWSANPPKPVKAMTRSPGSTPVTPDPTVTTSPAISLPGTKGTAGLIW